MNASSSPIIEFRQASVVGGVGEHHCFLSDFSWTLNPGEIWLITGPNGGGKTPFVQALAGRYAFRSGKGGVAVNHWEHQFSVVSFERAAELMEAELKNDDSDFVEGGVDIGQTPYSFLLHQLKDRAPFASFDDFCRNEWVRLCGLPRFAQTGLKFLSTGEVRRTLICLAFLQPNRAVVLFDPFSGLDAESRGALLTVFETLNRDYAAGKPGSICPIYCFNRDDEIPKGVNRVLEWKEGKASVYPSKAAWDSRPRKPMISDAGRAQAQAETAFETAKSFSVSCFRDEAPRIGDELIRMREVTVSWDGRKVLNRLNWTVHFGEHWLVQGPNGCGKTTLLELVTGDNMQLFCNEVFIFGRRRGTGESVWDIKRRLGIVSYRLHLEYRRVRSMTVEGVVLSGLFDSIGLYQAVTVDHRRAATFWLELGGFAGREAERFDDLSFGEQRAVLVLRAVIKAPPLLILDEPCQGLDEGNRKRVLWLIQKIAQTGISSLIHVTHEPSEILPCETHSLTFRDGRVTTALLQRLEP